MSGHSAYPANSNYPGSNHPGNVRHPGSNYPGYMGYSANNVPGRAGQRGHSPGYQGPSEAVQWFLAVDQDGSGQINHNELKMALVNSDNSSFSSDTCKLLISLYDKDGSGTIDVREFEDVFRSVGQWKKLFQAFDHDRSGAVNDEEMGKALQEMGYRFSSGFVQNIAKTFGGTSKSINLDKFILVFIQIQRLTNGFRSRDKAMRGEATFHFEDFLSLAIGTTK